MHVLIHNPSSIPVNNTVLKVPDGLFRLEIFNPAKKEYVKINNTKVICTEDRAYDLTEVIGDLEYQKLDFMNCQMHITHNEIVNQ